MRPAGGRIFCFVAAILLIAAVYYSVPWGIGQSATLEVDQLANDPDTAITPAARSGVFDPESLDDCHSSRIWEQSEIITERLDADPASRLAESFRVLRPLSDREIARLIPDDISDTQAAWSVAVDRKAL